MNHDGALSALPLYSMDLLDSAEVHELKAHLDTCPACRQELESLAQMNEELITELAQEDWTHHQELRASFQDKLQQEPPSSLIPLRRRPRPSWKMGAWVATAAIALMGWGSAYQAHRQADYSNQILAMVSHGRQITLASTTVGAARHVDLYLQPHSNNAMVWVRTLPPIRANQVYEGWWIVGKAPVPAGTFKLGPHFLARPAGAKAFAITVEPSGGTQKPTTPVLVVGTV